MKKSNATLIMRWSRWKHRLKLALAVVPATAVFAGYALAEDLGEPRGSFSPSSYEVTVDVPVPLDSLFVGGSNRLFGIRHGTRAPVLINFQKNQINETRFGTDVLSTHVTSNPYFGTLYFVLRKNRFGPEFEISVFEERGVFAATMPDHIQELDQFTFDFPDDFTEPSLLEIESHLILWDRDHKRQHDFYRIFTPNDSVGTRDYDITPKSYPYELLQVGSKEFLLALYPQEKRVSIINVKEGIPEDTNYLRGLRFVDPIDLAVFVPAQIYGGTGDVVVANAHDQLLTILSIGIGDNPRISQLLQIRFKVPQSTRKEDSQVLLVADRSLSTILLGTRGSDKMQVFRRNRGGLERLEPVRAEFPLADIAVLHERGVNAPEVFAFLRDNGQQIHLATLNKLFEKKTDDYTNDDRTAFVSAGRNDIATVQRVLASLGYKVGAIDGTLGHLTRSAIRTFQYENGLEPSGELDNKTLSVLNTQISIIRSGTDSDNTDVKDYTDFLSREVPGVEASHLLQLGVPHGIPTDPCFGLNSLPPRHLWENSINLARVLRRLQSDFGLDVKVTSAFHTPSYNRCISNVPNSRHLDFAAMDIQLRTPNLADSEALDILSNALKQVAAIDAIPLIIQPLKRSVHVELEPINQDLSATSGKGVGSRPTVYLKFTGGGSGLADELSRQLAERGFIIPGAQEHKAAYRTREVRFYHEEDRKVAEDLARATEIALKRIRVSERAQIQVVDMTSDPETKPNAGTLELWLSF